MKIIYSLFIMIIIFCQSTCIARNLDILDNGNLIRVDGAQGYGVYAVRSSVDVELYNPPNYRININTIIINDSTGQRGDIHNYTFSYNWDKKTVAYLSHQKNEWVNWDINHEYSHAEGDPMIPHLAEVAFVSAYKIKFYGNMSTNTYGYWHRVISDKFYQYLGI